MQSISRRIERRIAMDFRLTDAQRSVQEAARRFAEEEVAPLSREADEKGQFPLHLVKRLGELGFLAGPVDSAYAGSGMDFVSYAQFLTEQGITDKIHPRTSIGAIDRGWILSVMPCSVRNW